MQSADVEIELDKTLMLYRKEVITICQDETELVHWEQVRSAGD
jgi:hypothetical protein